MFWNKPDDSPASIGHHLGSTRRRFGLVICAVDLFLFVNLH